MAEAQTLRERHPPSVVAMYQQRLLAMMAESDLPVMSQKHATNRRCAAQKPEPRRGLATVLHAHRTQHAMPGHSKTAGKMLSAVAQAWGESEKSRCLVG